MRTKSPNKKLDDLMEHLRLECNKPKYKEQESRFTSLLQRIMNIEHPSFIMGALHDVINDNLRLDYHLKVSPGFNKKGKLRRVSAEVYDLYLDMMDEHYPGALDQEWE